MIFLSSFRKLSTTDWVVESRHFKPFDEKYGLGKTQSQLEETGILVDTIPDPEHKEGMIAELHIDPTTKVMSYTYIEANDIQGTVLEIQESLKTPDQRYVELDKVNTSRADLQSAKKAQLVYLYEQALAAGFKATLADNVEYTFGAADKDLTKANAAQTAIDKGFQTFPILYSDVQGHPVNVNSQADLDAILHGMANFGFAQHQQILNLVGQVVSAADNTAVNGIDWVTAAY